MDLKFLYSQRGKNIAICDGYIYNFDKASEEITRWRCQNRCCRGAIFLDGDNLIVNTVAHNHELETLKIKGLVMKEKIKIKALNSKESARYIIINETKNIPDNDLKDLQKFKTIRDRITKIRNMSYGVFNAESLDIPESLHKDLQGNVFFRFDSGVQDKSRIIIFSSEFKKKYFLQSEVLLIDGTFKIAPQGFLQVLTIQSLLFGRVFPLAYVFMCDKKESSYAKVFSKLKTLLTTLNPKYIITDFERALINSVVSEFPAAISNGCIFHFGQAIWKRIQALKQVKRYKLDKLYKQMVMMLLNLAFVPVEDVRNAYIVVKDWIVRKEIINSGDVLDYFETVYIGIFSTDLIIIKEPMYELSFWNVYQRVFNNIPRTTNSVEGWHRSINQKAEIAHPNIARLITLIQDEEEINRINILKSLSGDFALSKKNFLKEEKISVVVINYKFYDTLEYLKAISYIYGWEFTE